MFKRAVLALPLLFGLSQAQAQGTDEQVTTFTLENGMQVVLIEDHRAPVVSHMVWYRAGSADETPGRSGVAHFLEHLLFKGTKTLAPGEFSKVVAANGGTDNAFTNFDQTAYYQRVAADRLGLMMKMEADRMVNLQLDAEDILTERAVIIEERNMRTENDPAALFREQAYAAQYLNHPYGRPVIGWRHEMEALSLDDALAYYRQFYAPNNAIAIIAGDARPEEVRALAEQYYAPLTPNPAIPDRVRPQEPPQTAERRLMFADPRVSQPYVLRTYLAPERDAGAQKEAAALTMLAEILGGGQTSVLARKLQFENPIAVWAGAFYTETSFDDSTFGMGIMPVEGVSLDAAEKALDKAVAEFLKEGVDAAQLERIKFLLRAAQVYALDNAEGKARRYGQALTSGLTVEDVQAWPDVLEAVTAEDIMTAARKVLNRNEAVTGWLMKEQPEVTQ
ncbi:MAG: insulinase family protein [Roseivivax sp.]|nr:insulinase family protein [Roseivivax sp.]